MHENWRNAPGLPYKIQRNVENADLRSGTVAIVLLQKSSLF